MYDRIADCKKLSRLEWLSLRKKYIGGSDAGSILGVNPWSSPADIWRDKLADSEPMELDSFRIRIGNDLEAYVAKLFEEETGKKVRRNNFMMVNKKYPFMMANVDREVVGENRVLECKTTSSYNKEDWLDGNIPPHYYAQVQHYMAVCGYDGGYIAVLIGNEAFIWYEVLRDDGYIKAMIKKEEDFYNNSMVLGAFPSPDGSKAYSDVLKDRYKEPIPDSVVLDDLEPSLRQLQDVKGVIAKLKKTRARLEQEIQGEMGNHEIAYIGPSTVKWSNVVSKRFDRKAFEKDYPDLAKDYVKESSFRRFSI